MSTEKYAIYKYGETVTSSIYKDIVTFSFLSFCIWLSQGSTWWTLVTGVMFLAFGFGKMAIIMKQNKHVFKTKAELQKWVDGLEES